MFRVSFSVPAWCVCACLSLCRKRVPPISSPLTLLPPPCAQSLSLSLSSSDWRNPAADLGFQMSYTEPFYAPNTSRNGQVGGWGAWACATHTYVRVHVCFGEMCVCVSVCAWYPEHSCFFSKATPSVPNALCPLRCAHTCPPHTHTHKHIHTHMRMCMPHRSCAPQVFNTRKMSPVFTSPVENEAPPVFVDRLGLKAWTSHTGRAFRGVMMPDDCMVENDVGAHHVGIVCGAK